MEGLINSSSQEQSYDYSNITSNYQDYSNTTSNYQDYSNTTSNYQNYSNITSNYWDYSNITSNYQNYSSITSNYQDYSNTTFIIQGVTSIIIAVGLPLTLVAICVLYSQVRRDHVAPIYLINLLISDLIQFCCMIIQVAPNVARKIYIIFYHIYLSALFASVYFMVCISLERYLGIAHPLWCRFRRTI